MILTCPTCNSQFKISLDDLGTRGRKVRCTSCQEVWFQEPLSDDDDIFSTSFDAGHQVDTDFAGQDDESSFGNFDSEHDDNAEDDAAGQEDESSYSVGKEEEEYPRMPPATPQKPFVSDRARTMGYGVAAAVFVLILIPLLVTAQSTMQKYPQAQAFYGIFGIQMEIPGKNLVFDKMEVKQTDKEISVSGNIQNLGREAQEIPMIEVNLRSDKGDDLGMWYIQINQDSLEGEGRLPFSSAYNLQDTNLSDKNLRDVALRFVIVPRTVAGGGGSIPVPHEGDEIPPNADAGSLESHPHASSPTHPESEPGNHEDSRSSDPLPHTDDQADHNAVPESHH